jgi:deazaflavin-dependent oxidoreductase (nitroreductase family)
MGTTRASPPRNQAPLAHATDAAAVTARARRCAGSRARLLALLKAARLVAHLARPGRLVSGLARRWGGTRAGVWAIKHVVAPLDRWLYRRTGGRLLASGRPLGPVLLLTTRGRRTGRARTTPVYYLRDEERLVVCNVNPGFERPNPWTLNLRADPNARVQVGRAVGAYRAREATVEEVARYWPALVRLWPAYQTHYARSGRRVNFVLERAHDAAGGSPPHTGSAEREGR